MKLHLEELYGKYKDDGHRFQSRLGDFIRKNTPGIVVETGSGVSTLYMLKAMEETGIGRLYSIDPSPVGGYVVEHPRYQIIHKKSFQALAGLYKQTGPWNLFLHDSDHWIECMTYELEMAYNCVKEGGWIMADDYTWDSHNAWGNFVTKYSLGPHEFNLGSVQGIHKQPGGNITEAAVEALSMRLWDEAKRIGAVWRANNGRKPCWTCGDEYVESGTNRNA